MKHSCACLFLMLSAMSLTGCGLNFQEFSAPDGTFSVKVPGKPIKAAISGSNGEGWEVVAANWSFTIGLMNLPAQYTFQLNSVQQATAVDFAMKGIATAMRATTKSTAAINLNGFVGQEAELSLPAGVYSRSGRQEPATTAVIRCYLVNSRMLILVARSRYTITKDSADVKTFFDSLKISAAPSTPPAGMAGMPGGMPPANPGMNSNGLPAQHPNVPPGDPLAAANPSAMPAEAFPGAGAAMPARADAMPSSQAATPMPAAGSTMPQELNAAAGNASGMPNNGLPGQAGASNAPVFTGTPVAVDTKLTVGDPLQVYFNNQWINVKVTRVTPNGGFVQIRSLTKPPVYEMVPRSLLQKAPAADSTEMAANDAPASQPKPKGFINSTETDSSDMKSAGALPKSRSTGFAKQSSEIKSESVKSSGVVSLDGLSVDDLLKVLGKKTEHRRVQAAEMLRDHAEAGPNPEVAQKMVDLLKTDELILRAAIAQAMEKWACPEIQAAVVKNLSGGTIEVRHSMIKILAAINATDAAEPIAQCLADKDDRKVAADALRALGEPAQGAVIKMLDHRDSKVKTAACDILKEIGSADSITALKKATADWSGTDRLAARKALRALEAQK